MGWNRPDFKFCPRLLWLGWQPFCHWLRWSKYLWGVWATLRDQILWVKWGVYFGTVTFSPHSFNVTLFVTPDCTNHICSTGCGDTTLIAGGNDSLQTSPFPSIFQPYSYCFYEITPPADRDLRLYVVLEFVDYRVSIEIILTDICIRFFQGMLFTSCTLELLAGWSGSGWGHRGCPPSFLLVISCLWF